MYLGFLAALGLSRVVPFFRDVNGASPSPCRAGGVHARWSGCGAIDDTRGTTALSKLTAQIFIAGVVVLVRRAIRVFVGTSAAGQRIVVLSATCR